MSAPLVLDDNDVSTITNALSVAAESCERHAVEAEQAAIRGAFEDSAKSYRQFSRGSSKPTRSATTADLFVLSGGGATAPPPA